MRPNRNLILLTTLDFLKVHHAPAFKEAVRRCPKLAQSRHGTTSDSSPLCAPNRTSISRDYTACCKNDYGTDNSNGEMMDH
jgi:hypothetical protein